MNEMNNEHNTKILHNTMMQMDSIKIT